MTTHSSQLSRGKRYRDAEGTLYEYLEPRSNDRHAFSYGKDLYDLVVLPGFMIKQLQPVRKDSVMIKVGSQNYKFVRNNENVSTDKFTIRIYFDQKIVSFHPPAEYSVCDAYAIMDHGTDIDRPIDIESIIKQAKALFE